MSRIIYTVTIIALLALSGAAQVVQEDPAEMRDMGIEEHLGDTIPLDIMVTNDAGETVPLSYYFHRGKPVIVTLVYYNCPMLCNLILNGVTDGLKELPLMPGKDFEVVTVSFNPRETSELAAAKKKNYLSELGRPGADAGWAFCAATEDQSKRLADAVGFSYYWDEERQEFAHPSAIYVLTDEGRISRYLYGITFTERDLRLSLIEASEGKIGTTIDKFILYCFHYDPDARGYVVMAGNVMKLGGLLTLILLGLLIGVLWSRERLRRSRENVYTH